MNLIKIDDLLGSNKADRLALAQSIVESINQGDIDAVQALIYAAKGEEIFKALVDNIRPIVSGKQIQKGGIKLFEAEIIERKNPDKYDFATCNDFKWNELNDLLFETKVKIKERETFLKALTEPISTIEGEVISVPEKIHGAMNIAIKFL